MVEQQHSLATLQNCHGLLAGVLSLLSVPAAIVTEANRVIASNAAWLSLIRWSRQTDNGGSLDDFLACFAHPDALSNTLKECVHRSGSLRVVATRQRDDGDAGQRAPEQRSFNLAWKRMETDEPHGTAALLVLHDASSPLINEFLPPLHYDQMNQLLVRQTLIEEAERHKIGQMLHDGLVQDLAQIRAVLVSNASLSEEIRDAVGTVDQMIDDARTLVFEICPPVLEDLGLLPALKWLAGYMSDRYDASIAVATDSSEPPLSKSAQIIAFRAIRELITNAVKHAPGSEVIISCVSNPRRASILVIDDGPGFDARVVPSEPGQSSRFGLVSVEQQIRGIGGRFELFSTPGDGTRASIQLPIMPDERQTHDSHNHRSARG